MVGDADGVYAFGLHPNGVSADSTPLMIELAAPGCPQLLKKRPVGTGSGGIAVIALGIGAEKLAMAAGRWQGFERPDEGVLQSPRSAGPSCETAWRSRFARRAAVCPGVAHPRSGSGCRSPPGGAAAQCHGVLRAAGHVQLEPGPPVAEPVQRFKRRGGGGRHAQGRLWRLAQGGQGAVSAGPGQITHAHRCDAKGHIPVPAQEAGRE